MDKEVVVKSLVDLTPWNLDPKLSEAEQKIVAYLHEKATAFDESSTQRIGEVMKAAGLDETAFKKALSFLVPFKLVKYGLVHERPLSDGYMHLTHFGENWQRHLGSRTGGFQVA